MLDPSLRHEQFVAAASQLFGSLSASTLDEIEPLAEWRQLVRGDALFRQGQASTGLYVVMSGRLQVVRENADGTTIILGEAGPGESVGEMGFFTKEPRSASVVALRDSLLVRFPNAAFERIVASHPEVVRDLTRMMIHRV